MSTDVHLCEMESGPVKTGGWNDFIGVQRFYSGWNDFIVGGTIL
jgi:hypothetical protein